MRRTILCLALLLFAVFPAAAKPDLVVAGIAIQPEVPSDGETATAIAAIQNIGSAPASGFYVAFYIDGRSAGSQEVSRLDPNATANVTFRWTAKPDHLEVRAAADDSEYTGYRNRVDEDREDNNDLAVPVRVGLADLAVREVVFEPSDPPHDGEQTTAAVTVENRGNSTRTSFYVALYVDGTGVGTAEIDSGLGSGREKTVRFSWRATAEARTIAAVADDSTYTGYKNRVQETNESNNRFERPVDARLADLVVETIALEPDPPGDGEEARVKVTVANRGSSTRTPFYVALYADGRPLGTQSVENGLVAGATATPPFTWTAQPGTLELRAVADDSEYSRYRNRVRETDESNNGLSRDAPVNLSDLKIARIEVKPADPAAPLAGQHADVEVTVVNSGGSTRRSFYVTLYADGQELASLYVEGGLRPGQERVLQVPWTPTPVARLTAVADDCSRTGCKNLVAERDEENNGLTVETGIPVPPSPSPIPTLPPEPEESRERVPAHSPPPARRETSRQEDGVPGASVQLRGEKTRIAVGEEVLLTLSIVNLITNPPLTVQVILKVPSGMGVASSTFAESGAGQYTGVFRAEPGESKHVTVRVRANQAGSFQVGGQLVYFLGEDRANGSQQSVSMPVQVIEPAPQPSEALTGSQIAAKAPGFTVLLAAGALVGLALLVGRRSKL